MKIKTLKIDENMTPDKLKTTKHGWPEVTCMPITNDSSLLAFPERAKDHPVWKNESKPWGYPTYPHQSLHTSSV